MIQKVQSLPCNHRSITVVLGHKVKANLTFFPKRSNLRHLLKALSNNKLLQNRPKGKWRKPHDSINISLVFQRGFLNPQCSSARYV